MESAQENIQEGFILQQLEDGFVKIRVSGHANCDNCQSCDVANLEIIAYNPLSATVGQKVKFIMVEENMLKIAVMVFLFPLLSVFVGLYTGYLIAIATNMSKGGFMFGGACVFLAIAIVIIYMYDKKFKLNKSNFPQVIEVISR
ncbi:MAG TPA: SoxR reducing system RseC family protein [Spirochaetota bacterium]|nr:SoxR reducing system RseC family protein [Spirochaetota bacterium]HPD78914.1 SoxR reducing system RseC family protein [Spirochaetota bacterium]HRS64040.1 SoxR reducing system RseC family protein [Spirochaetota bacterium]HRU66649.1 SoxR reducing system RseC family protein [Spirochaetota bacterium]